MFCTLTDLNKYTILLQYLAKSKEKKVVHTILLRTLSTL